MSNPQASLTPLKNHLKQLKKKLNVKYFPKHRTCFLFIIKSQHTVLSFEFLSFALHLKVLKWNICICKDCTVDAHVMLHTIKPLSRTSRGKDLILNSNLKSEIITITRLVITSYQTAWLSSERQSCLKRAQWRAYLAMAAPPGE